jgi:hypothetical protein
LSARNSRNIVIHIVSKVIKTTRKKSELVPNEKRFEVGQR